MNRRDLQQWARRLKTEVYALYLVYKDPRVPRYARALAAVVAGYAFSPIDLIPDPIPILGYLGNMQGKPVNKTAAAVILIWLLLAIAAVALILRLT